jgi:DNA-binding CsgD family transcriptional regulator
MSDRVLHIPELSHANHLTRTEVRVLSYIASGCTHIEAAAILCRSPHTVENHMRNIHRKVGTSRTALLAQFARMTGIIPAEPVVVLPTPRLQKPTARG